MTSLLLSDFLWQRLLADGLTEASEIQFDILSLSLLLISIRGKEVLHFP